MKADWKPIDDEAKKKGPIVLTNGGYFIIGFWQTDRWMTGYNAGSMRVQIDLEPTHWDDLPEGPSREPAAPEGAGR